MQNSEDPQFFRWAAGLTVVRSAEGMGLLLEDRQFLVNDPLLIAIVGWLESGRTEEELILKLCPPAAPQAVRDAVDDLRANQVIVMGHAQSSSRNATAFWDTCSSAGPRQAIRVHSLIPKFGPALEALLRASGVAVDAQAERILLVTDDYLRLEVREICGQATAVLPVKPVGKELWAGPLLGAQESMCWECVSYWLRIRRWPEYSITGVDPNRAPQAAVFAGVASGMTAASGLAATAGALWSADLLEGFRNHLWIFDFSQMRQSRHPLFPRACCGICRRPVSREERDAHWRDPRTGILQKLRMPAEKIGSTFLTHAATLLPLPETNCRRALPPFSADGRGTTPEEAAGRCLNEAVERSSMVFTGSEPLIRARLKEIDGIAPNEVALLSTRQFESRVNWNAAFGGRHMIPEEFDPARETGWVTARSLTDSRNRLIPAGVVYLGYPFADEPFFFHADSNGCAAGESIEQATLHGLLELIERDALAIWWYNRVRRPGLDIAASPGPELRVAQEYLALQGRSLDILDLTHDLRVPCYVAVSSDESGNRIYLGCAADVCGVRAANRAVSELLQLWYWGREIAPVAGRRENVSLARDTYLIPDGLTAQTGKRSQMRQEEALGMCLDAVRGAGVDAYVIDLTRPEFGVPVVRVIAPGLRHYGPNFAGGRMYDVPVKAGWTLQRRSEEEMNPEPCAL